MVLKYIVPTYACGRAISISACWCNEYIFCLISLTLMNIVSSSVRVCVRACVCVCVCVRACSLEWEKTFVFLNADTSVCINYKLFVWVKLNWCVSLAACLRENDRGTETESGRESNLILRSVSPSIIAFPQETRWLHSTRDSVTASPSSEKQEPPQPNP